MGFGEREIFFILFVQDLGKPILKEVTILVSVN